MTNVPSPFEALPAEVQVIVLKKLPDVQSLLACIAASPDMLRLYCPSREQIFITVVQNMIGGNVLRQAMFLIRDPEPCLSIEDYTTAGSHEISILNVKALLREERLTRSIIQASVDDELGQKVQLTDVEWLRLRRGLYNYRVMVRLSRDEGEEYYWTFEDVTPFCQLCTSYEILEMLYLLYCLRNGFRKNLQSLEDNMLHALKYDAFVPDFDDVHALFAQRLKESLFVWNSDGPWQHRVSFLYEHCQPVARGQPIDLDFAELSGEVDQISTLTSFIPNDHDFSDARGDGFRWLDRYNKLSNNGLRYDYHHAIPLGFMIWDDERLKDMSWMRTSPPLEPVPEKWLEYYRDYKSVEQRFFDAYWSRDISGEKLHTWLNPLPTGQNGSR